MDFFLPRKFQCWQVLSVFIYGAYLNMTTIAFYVILWNTYGAMKYISTSINIHASAKDVWQVLSNFEDYPAWNPFIRNIEGTLQVGSTLTATIQLPDSRPMAFRPKIISYKEGHHLTWVGHFLIPGIFDGEHSFEIHQKSGGVIQFIQKESFKGILIPFMGGMLGKTKKGFTRMNKALKERVE
jgi:hypothetical protein